MDNNPQPTGRALLLVGLALVSAFGYAVLLGLSGDFSTEHPNGEKPTLVMLALFAALFACYWLALWLAIRLPATRVLVGGILATSALFRVLLLPSLPMHEIDLYRYLWDGAVLAEGVSPYRYAPQQVVAAAAAPASITDPTLRRLVDLQNRSRSLGESLHKIDHGQYASPYPPVSQAVFALSAQLTPDSASRHTRLAVMKGLLVLWDMATLVVVVLLLASTGKHPGWSLAYGWCPLVLKEFANSGHLDSIAICLTTLAVWLLVRPGATRLQAALSGAVLALAIGAKLYPLVLLPLFAALWLRRQGWGALCAGLSVTTLLSGLLLAPLLAPALMQRAVPAATDPPVASSSPPENGPEDGIQAFFQQWEMNDLLFMVVLENLRPPGDVQPARRPWFDLTPEGWSRTIVTRWVQLIQPERANETPMPPSDADLRVAAFSLARVLTGGIFGWVACLLAWVAAGSNDPQRWCRTVLLTLAWFWLTCPTQNPWYWCWAIPFLPFARYRTWYLVAAVTMLYYLRFWFTAHYPEPPTWGTRYEGAYFFYFVIAWVEFAPVLVALAAEWLWARQKNRSQV
jgi:hypothetical protein